MNGIQPLRLMFTIPAILLVALFVGAAVTAPSRAEATRAQQCAKEGDFVTVKLDARKGVVISAGTDRSVLVRFALNASERSSENSPLYQTKLLNCYEIEPAGAGVEAR